MNVRATERERNPIPYRKAVAAQECWVRRRVAGAVPDLLWLLEHPPTITVGSAGGGERHVLLAGPELRRRGVEVHESKRGGDVTFHAPGQIVGYPIVRLGTFLPRDLHEYLRRVEEGVIRYLAQLGLDGFRVPGRTGVWVDRRQPRKIAAMGVRAQRWVTSHGFALNVENSLEGFGWIVPCGIQEAGVTSLAKELGPERVPSWHRLCRDLHAGLEGALGASLRLLLGEEGLPGAT